jgi:hypothetical protein
MQSPKWMAPPKVIHASTYGDVAERSMNYDVAWHEWVKCMKNNPQVPRVLGRCLESCENDNYHDEAHARALNKGIHTSSCPII